jgi:ethanolaminephosphotransferase
LLVYAPDLQTPGPNWIYISFAVGMWAYSTFDNVDGKQARRTGTSSPLGELFDHAVDALNCTTGGLLQAAGIVLGPSYWTFGIVAIASTAFFFATWETFYTGTLYLGTVNGPTEGLLIAISTLVVSGIYGPTVWNTRALDVIPASLINPILSRMPFQIQYHFKDLIISHLSIYIMILCLFIFQIPDSITRVYGVCKQKNISFIGALGNVVAYFLLLGSLFAWTIAPGSKVIPNNVLVLCLAWGIAVARFNVLLS